MRVATSFIVSITSYLQGMAVDKDVANASIQSNMSASMQVTQIIGVQVTKPRTAMRHRNTFRNHF